MMWIVPFPEREKSALPPDAKFLPGFLFLESNGRALLARDSLRGHCETRNSFRVSVGTIQVHFYTE